VTHGSGGPTNLCIQNDASLLVNPKILLHQLAILLREETIREANEAVGRRHSWGRRRSNVSVFFEVLNYQTEPCGKPGGYHLPGIIIVFTSSLAQPVAAWSWSGRETDCMGNPGTDPTA